MISLSFIGDLTMDIYPKLHKTVYGGASFTSAKWAVKLGAESSILAAVGDKDGIEFINEIKKQKIDASCIKILNGKTSQIEIFIDGNGEHTFGEWDPGVYADYHPGKKEFDFLKTQNAVCLPVYYKTKHLLNELCERLAFSDKRLDINKKTLNAAYPLSAIRYPLISVDFDDLSQFGKTLNIIEDHLQYIDIVKLGLDIDIDGNLIAEIKKLARKNTDKLFLITLNKNGSTAFYKGKEYCQKADKINVTDTTGAGDAYIAGFLVGYVKSQNISDAMRIGTKTATKHIRNLEVAETGNLD